MQSVMFSSRNNTYNKKQEKKEETLTVKMKRSLDERDTQTHGSLIETDVFIDQKRVNVCEHMVKMALCESFGKMLPEQV